MAWSLSSSCYPRQHAEEEERSMGWMVAQLCSGVASCPTRRRRAVCLSVARLQSAGAGSGLETKRSEVGAQIFLGHVFVDSYSSSSSQSLNETQIPRHVDSINSAVGTSLRRQTKGSQRWLGRLGPTRSEAHPARLFAAADHSNSTRSRRVLEHLHTEYNSDFSA